MSEIPFAAETAGPGAWRRVLVDLRLGVPAYLVGCIVLGIIGALVWALATTRPGYVVNEDLTAHIGERGLADMFGADAMFVIVTGVLGILTGIASWLMFHRTGWWVCVLAIIGAALSAVAVWQFGSAVGEHGFSERLASAAAGDVVAINLQLRAHGALLVAPFLAITPVMLFAAFWPEGERQSEPEALVEGQLD